MVGMFIIGFVIFSLYLFGLLYAIRWGHNSQRRDMENDPELRGYYNRHNNWDKEIVEYDKRKKRNDKRRYRTKAGKKSTTIRK
jgi:hypothetical protein|tara:strand:+ start:548 stop:796 length:249 start_codon:yes stop_codon:yes gene_type:complete